MKPHVSALLRAIDAAGSQKALAEKIADRLGRPLSQQAVSYWVQKGIPLDAEYAIAIEHVTSGSVRRADLRPDVFGSQAA